MKNYILLLFLGFTFTLHAQQEIMLNVSHVAQGNTEWCSTAAAKCILDYYKIKDEDGKSISQCKIMDEYIRKLCNSHGGPNGYGCCLPIPNIPMDRHPCNKGVNLGVFNERASVKGILMHFGDIFCIGFESAQNTWYIENKLNNNHLIVAQWNYWYPNFGEPDAHTVVIHGVKVMPAIVYYMDPAPQPPHGDGGLNFLSWADFNNNINNDNYKKRKHWWAQTLALTGCSSGRGDDYPCHCYNGIFEPEHGEEGFDCGGTCPDCPTPSCFNCLKDSDEEEMDCGGPCSPCEDVPVERSITNTNQLRPETMAFNKITAGGATTIASGKTVSFLTEKEGSIVLLPGFKAENGCTFTTQRRNLSGSGRICGKICGKWWTPSSIKYNEGLYIHDLQYAHKIEYEISTLNGSYSKSYVKDISHNGTVFLWNPPFYLENVTYRIIYDTYHCDDSKRRGGRDFTVIGYNGGKSLNEEPGELETQDTFLSPPNNIMFQDGNTAPSFVIIPNPNPGTFQIESNFPLFDIANLKILNPLGATVYETQDLTSNTIQLQTSTTGTYFVVIILKDGAVLTRKMVIQK